MKKTIILIIFILIGTINTTTKHAHYFNHKDANCNDCRLVENFTKNDINIEKIFETGFFCLIFVPFIILYHKFYNKNKTLITLKVELDN